MLADRLLQSFDGRYETLDRLVTDVAAVVETGAYATSLLRTHSATVAQVSEKLPAVLKKQMALLQGLLGAGANRAISHQALHLPAATLDLGEKRTTYAYL